MALELAVKSADAGYIFISRRLLSADPQIAEVNVVT